MSVEDIASQSSVVFETRQNDTISGIHIHVSPVSAETLARRVGITNHHLIAYSLSNISAKNYQNRLAKNYQNHLMWVEVIVCYISVVCFETQCTSTTTTTATTVSQL